MTVFVSRTLSLVALVGALAVLALPPGAQAKTEIHFWHALSGQLGEALETQARQFNDSQGEY
jgi:sn-glycerol 3-phosphate transport system substrate-binding protein